MTVGGAIVTLRDAGPDDEQLVRELFAQSRVDLALLPAPTRDLMLDLQYRAQAQHYAAAHPGAHHRVIEAGGTGIGRLLVDAAGDTVHIVDVTVHEQHRGRGVGSMVLERVIAEAEAGDRAVTLAVWSANLGAQRLYARLGFLRVPDHQASKASTVGDPGYLQLRRDPKQEVE